MARTSFHRSGTRPVRARAYSAKPWLINPFVQPLHGSKLFGCQLCCLLKEKARATMPPGPINPALAVSY